MDTPKHPGYIPPQPNAEALAQERGKRSFDAYLRFMNTEGLSLEEQDTLVSLAQDIFNYNSRLWEPSLCKWWMISTVDGFRDSKIQIPPNVQVDPMYAGDHFWLRVVYKGETRMIIDPTGLSISSGKIENYVPYFGREDMDGRMSEECYMVGTECSAEILNKYRTSPKRIE